MSIEQIVKLVAKSRMQTQLVRDMLNGYAVHSPAYGLRGSAQHYRFRYETAFTALLERLRWYGFVVRQHRGPRGGIGSATYTLIDVGYVAR